MNEVSSSRDPLLPASGASIEMDYLSFLAERVPKDIAAQLRCDGKPDLGASESISVTDLVRPLSTHVFPSAELQELARILGYMIMCYTPSLENKPSKHDPYKLMYAGSLYLHCFVHGKGPEASGYLQALGMFTDVCMRLNFETRLQACRFLGSLIPTISAEATTVSALLNEQAPASSALIALSVIVGSVASDLSLKTESTMKSEKIREAWAEEEAYKETSIYWGMRLLKRYISEMFGVSGKVRQGADRFLAAIEDGKNRKRDISEPEENL
jgi:hypothetical protein